MSFRAPPTQKKNEILVVTPGYTTPMSGAKHVVGDLIAAIAERAPFHFTWAAHEGSGVPEIPGQTLLPMHGWKMAEDTLGFRWPFWDRGSRKELRQAAFASDLVWLHDTLYPGALSAFRIARALRRPVLVTQHESPVFYAGYGGRMRRRWASFTDRFTTTGLLKKAQQVTFTSAAAARFYNKRVSFRTPARVIPNGVEGGIFHPPSADNYRGLRTRFALRDDQPVLLFVGRFETGSGLTVIRHMARQLPKWRFWLAGHGGIKPESWYLPNVQVFRNRAGASLAELYQSADLLILPGYDADAPHVLRQALACQLPVMCSAAVVSGRPGAPRCLVVKTDPGSAKRTAEHWVQKLKAGKDIWPASSGTEADTPFDANWDWPQVATHYIEILDALCRAAA